MTIIRRGLSAFTSQFTTRSFPRTRTTSLSEAIANISLKAAAAASGRLESSLAAAEPLPNKYSDNSSSTTADHRYQKREGLLVDTLDMMRKFEQIGMDRQQAEALTQSITEILCTNRDRLAECYVSKGALEKSELQAQASIAGFRAEVLKSQELQVATSTRDTERLQSNLEKIRSEIRYEIDKLTASQRLDLNLEKGRMRDELQMLRDKTNELDIKVDKEVNSLKAAMEQSKNDTVKYVLGLMLALLTAGLGAARLVMH